MTGLGDTTRPRPAEIIAHAKAHGLTVRPDGDQPGAPRGGVWLVLFEDSLGDLGGMVAEIYVEDGEARYSPVGLEAEPYGDLDALELDGARSGFRRFRYYALDRTGAGVPRASTAEVVFDVLRRAGALVGETAEEEQGVGAASNRLARSVAMCVSNPAPAQDFDALAVALEELARVLFAAHDCDSPDRRRLTLARDALALGAEATGLYMRRVAEGVAADAETARAEMNVEVHVKGRPGAWDAQLSDTLAGLAARGEPAP